MQRCSACRSSNRSGSGDISDFISQIDTQLWTGANKATGKWAPSTNLVTVRECIASSVHCDDSITNILTKMSVPDNLVKFIHQKSFSG